MAFRIFNTQARRLEQFRPLEEGEVRMYTCGPTVWDYAHIGNFRAFVFYDLLRRYLRYRGYQVKHVMNLTDVEDRIIDAVRHTGRTARAITDEYTRAFFEDLDTLNIEHAEVYPRATEHIEDIVQLVRTLLQKGYAYRSDDGSIYYDISRFPSYGKLSRLRRDQRRPGARVKVDHYDEKKEAYDFALWKAWDPDDGDVYWETELGKGRPGWHIECSAMSMRYLGPSFDLHAGGIDLIFPHHENEIAQSEAATGKPFARYWVHNAHLVIEGEKMSKSLGNYVTLRDLLKQGHDPVALRFLLLATHYRKQLNLTAESLSQAASSVARLRDLRNRLQQVTLAGPAHSDLLQHLTDSQKAFENAMDEDLNVPEALAHLFDTVRFINKELDRGRLTAGDASEALRHLQRADSVLGVLVSHEPVLSPQEEALVQEREQARQRRDWVRADAIRAELLRRGLHLEDTATGPVVKRVSPPTQ